MADYKIHLGVKLNTGDVNTQISKIEGGTNPVNVKAILDATDIKTKIAEFNNQEITIKSILSTRGWKTTLKNFKDSNTLNVNSTLNTDGIASKLDTYALGKKVTFDATVTTTNINSAIKQYNAGQGKELISLDVKLEDGAIAEAIKAYKQAGSAQTIPIKLQAISENIDFSKVEELLEGYTPRTPLKLKVTLQKGDVNDAIAEYNAGRKAGDTSFVTLGVRLTHDAIAKAIENYSVGEGKNLQIPVNLSLQGGTKNAEFVAELAKVRQELVNTPLEAPVVLTRAKDYANQVNKFPINVEAKLQNKEEIRAAITGATKGVTDIPVKLKPVKGFTSAIENKPVPVKAKLDDNSITTISGQLANIKRETPVVVDAKLNPTSVEKITTELTNIKPKAPIEVDAKINETIVDDKNQDSKPKKSESVTVKPIVDDESIDAQLEAYRGSILVDVLLQTENISEQLKGYKPTPKLNVGVNLDFASHKDGTKGVPQQIKDYTTKSKIKVGVELDKEDVNRQIQDAQSDEPLRLGVQLDLDPVRTQIEELREEFRRFGQITINFPNANNNNNNNNGNGSGNGGNGGGGGGQPPVPPIDDVQRFTAAICNADDVVNGMRENLRNLGVSMNNVRFDDITRDIQDMNIEVQRVTTSINGANLTMSVTGIQETEDGIRRIVTESRRYEGVIHNSLNINRRFTQDFETSFDRIAERTRQVNREYQQMKSLAGQIKSAWIDYDNAKASGGDFDVIEQKLVNLIARYDELEARNSGSLNAQQVRQLSIIWDDVADSVDVAGQKMANVTQRKAALEQRRQEIKDINSAYTEMISLAKEIGKTEIKIGKLRETGQSVDALEAKLVELKTRFSELDAGFTDRLSESQFRRLINTLTDVEYSAEEAREAMENMQAQTAKGIRGNFNGYEATIEKLVRDMNQLSGECPEVEHGIGRLRQALLDMRNAGDDSTLIKAEERYQEELKETQGLLNLRKASQGQIYDEETFVTKKAAAQARLNGLFEIGSQAAKRFGAQAAILNDELHKTGNIKGVDIVTRKISALETTIRRSNLQTKTFTSRIKEQLAKYAQYISVASVFMRARQAAVSMFEQVKLIDSAMTELKKVTNETDASYNKFLTNAASKAKELGTTVDGLVSSTADFARLGYSFEDSQGLAEVANIYAVVGDEIDSVETATKSLISTLTAFKDEASGLSDSDFAMSIVDKMNEVSNNFAISSGGIGEALQKSASSMMAANNTLDETIALITAANTVVQNPEVIGTAFKTISMRIRGAKTELEEAGLETEGMVESTATLREEIKALSGVDIMLNANEFKSTYQILEELAAKWQDLTDIQQASVTELIAGKRQGNVISSLMNNFDIANDALKTSLNSSGSAMAEHEKWQKSLEAQLLKLKASWQAFSQSFMSSGILKFFIGGAAKVLDILTKITDTIGTLPTLIGIGFAGKSLFDFITKDKKRIDDVAGSINHLANAIENSAIATDIATAANKKNTASEIAEAQASTASATAEANETAANTASVATEEAENKANLKSTTSELAEANANATSTTSELAEAGANAISTTTELAEAEANATSTTSELAEANANAASTTSELAEAGANVASSASEAKEALTGLGTAITTVGSGAAKTAGGGLKALLGKLLGFAAAHPVITATIAAIAGGIGVFSHFHRSAKELAEDVEHATSKFKEQHEELVRGQSNFKAEAERYAELSKGVGAIGENIALTIDEYEEYQKLANSIADRVPSLVKSYDDEGNAILNVKDNVDSLIQSYKELIIASNNELLFKMTDDTDGSDVFEDFKNKQKKTNKTGFWSSIFNNNKDLTSDGYNALQKVFKAMSNGDDISEAIDKYFKNGHSQTVELVSQLKENGVKQKKGESGSEFIKRAFAENEQIIESIMSDYKATIESNIASLRDVTNAYFSNAFLTDYEDMSDFGKNIINNILPNLDANFYEQFETYDDLIARFKSMLDDINNLDNGTSNQIETALELKTKFNNGDISYGEYVSRVKEASDLITNTDLDDEIKSQLQLDLDVDEVTKNYDALKKRLTSDEFGIQMKTDEAEEFLSGLTASEYAVAIDLIADKNIDFSEFNIDSLREYIEEQAKLNEAMAFTVSIDVESENLEALNTALSESVSSMGLSSESLKALQSRYEKLDSFDPYKLFEKTSQGIHLNRDELNKLEKELAKSKIDEIDETLETVTEAYKDVTEEIRTCSDEKQRELLVSKQLSYANKIKELSELQTQYRSLTSAYNNWVNAQESGEEGDIYDDVITKLESAAELRKKGLVGTNEFSAAVEFMSGKDTASMTVDEIVAAYDKALPKMKRYFTDSSKGASNLLNDLSAINKEWATFENGEWKLNIPIKEAAKELGISADALEAVLGKGSDYGLTINHASVYEASKSLEELHTEAELANNKLKELEKTDLTFSFKSTDADDLTSQIEEAQKLLDEFRNEDGTVNLDIEGAEQAKTVLETLMLQKQEVTKPAFMEVSYSVLGDADLGNAIRLIQNLQSYKNTYDVQVAISADTSETETKIQEVITEINTLKEKNPQVFADLNLDTEEFNTALNTLSGNINADVQLDPNALATVQTKLNEVDAKVLADIGIGDATALSEIAGKANVTPEPTTTDLGSDFIGSGTINVLPNVTDLGSDFTGSGTIAMTPYLTTDTVTVKVREEKIAEVNGTANVNGTTGQAFKQGSWGIKDSGTALVGELGTETLVRDGHYYTIGNNGAEFINYRKGDIIFNHKQTEELFKNGRVTSGGGRGRAIADGTAFAEGNAFALGNITGGGSLKAVIKDTVAHVIEDKEKTNLQKLDKSLLKKNTTTTTTTTGGGTLYGGSGGSGGGSSSEKDKFEETIDWIEVAINRIERAIDQLDSKANNVYKNWSDRNTALVGEISKVEDEIALQEKAYNRYIQQANSVGLSSSWAEKVRNGEIDISTITDENLADKIKDYQTWYEKALDCQDAIDELKEKESALYKQRFDNVSTQYEGILGVIEHEKNMLDEYIAQTEAQAWLVSENYYKALSDNEKDNISELEKQKAAMLKELQVAMESGTIDKSSEAWYEMVNAVDEVTLSIEQGKTKLLEYDQTLQQLGWERFDLLQEKISAVTEESEFLIDLLSNEKLYDDNGQLTDAGMATMGLYGQNYNVHMSQADMYGAEAERLKAELAKDPFDTELEKRYREVVSLQQEHILAAEGEKEAIRDMVEEGIELELDALQERIDKYNEALDSQKDLYDYQKKVKEQTKEIASLEKQMAAYAGDDSEEAKAKVQELKVSLEEAKENLQETEYEKYISDQQQLLDELYLEYEEILNMRLDNVDALMSDMITEINSNATTISDTLSGKADSVGYTLSESMGSIWDTNSTKINGVITTYGEKFSTAQTTTNNTLSTINSNLQNMITQLNSIAKTNVKSASTSSAANSKEANTTKKPTTTNQKPASTPAPAPAQKSISVGGKIYAGGAQIYDYVGDTSGEGQYYGKDPVYIVLEERNGYLKVRYHKLSSGVTGWFKKSDVSAYATGKRNFLDDEIAWTQDGGREFIVRPSDGAILTPIAKGDSVLNANASSNIWDMANSPAEFIRDNLNLASANVPNNSNVQNNYTQNLDKVVFSFPNVKNYNEFIAEMQKDKSFEKLVHSMTIDRLAGKSSLAKNKIIR